MILMFQPDGSTLEEQIALLDALAHVAREYGEGLDVAQLATLMELYAQLLESGHDASSIGFAEFVADPEVIGLAATLAERETGVAVPRPASLA